MTREGQNVKPTTGVLIMLLILNIAISIICLYVYDQYFARKVAVIDIRGYMMDRKNLFLSGKMSEKEFTASVDNIEKALKQTNKRTVVLLGDAVVRNAEKIHIED
jgi:hypothetical protein